MDIDVAQIAAAAVTLIAPFAPYLLEAGKTSAKAFAETLGDKSAEIAWGKAQELWTKIVSYFAGDIKIEAAAKILSLNPNDNDTKKILSKFIAEQLISKPELVNEFISILGGSVRIQKLLAEEGSWVEDVVQEMQSGGIQAIEAKKNSVVRNAKQIQQD